MRTDKRKICEVCELPFIRHFPNAKYCRDCSYKVRDINSKISQLKVRIKFMKITTYERNKTIKIHQETIIRLRNEIEEMKKTIY